jgi:carbon-monoxide dehydrogenase iron sulfur subunit
MVCPFDAVTFYPQANGMPVRIVAMKCDGCIERVRNGVQPACVEACKVNALVYGELNELTAAGRLQQTAAVLAVTTSEEPIIKPPGTVSGWRDWGETTTKLSEGI